MSKVTQIPRAQYTGRGGREEEGGEREEEGGSPLPAVKDRADASYWQDTRHTASKDDG